MSYRSTIRMILIPAPPRLVVQNSIFLCVCSPAADPGSVKIRIIERNAPPCRKPTRIALNMCRLYMRRIIKFLRILNNAFSLSKDKLYTQPRQKGSESSHESRSALLRKLVSDVQKEAQVFAVMLDRGAMLSEHRLARVEESSEGEVVGLLGDRDDIVEDRDICWAMSMVARQLERWVGSD